MHQPPPSLKVKVTLPQLAVWRDGLTKISDITQDIVFHIDLLFRTRPEDLLWDHLLYLDWQGKLPARQFECIVRNLDRVTNKHWYYDVNKRLLHITETRDERDRTQNVIDYSNKLTKYHDAIDAACSWSLFAAISLSTWVDTQTIENIFENNEESSYAAAKNAMDITIKTAPNITLKKRAERSY